MFANESIFILDLSSDRFLKNIFFPEYVVYYVNLLIYKSDDEFM